MDFIAAAFLHAEPTDLSLEDILMWADDTWCYRYELTQMSHMSDDYRVIPFASEGYLDIVGDM